MEIGAATFASLYPDRPHKSFTIKSDSNLYEHPYLTRENNALFFFSFSKQRTQI